MANKIGIMQGRLLPPENNHIQAFPRLGWRDEFHLAKEAGLDFIEWIVDDYGMDVNPLVSETDLDELLALSNDTGVKAASMCADIFMQHPLIRCTRSQRDERIALLHQLIRTAAKAGMAYIILPFVDAAKFESEQEIMQFVSMMRDNILPAARESNVEIHLESSLEPARIETLMDALPDSAFYMNYDSGNSSSLGYDPAVEFSTYGSRIGSVHIKDRLLGGSTVPLGSGSANFDALFEGLKTTGYSRSYVLQVARDTTGNEVSWAEGNREWLQQRLDRFQI